MSFVLLFVLPLSGVAAERTQESAYSIREWRESDGLPLEDVAGVLCGRDGALWIAHSNGLARFDGTQFWNYPFKADDGQEPALLRILAEMPGQGIVAPPRTGGLVTLREGAYRRVTLPAVCEGRVFNALFTAADGALWAGTSDGTVFRMQSGSALPHQLNDGLQRPAVFTFATAGSGETWVANGAHVYVHQGDKLVPFALGRAPAELRIASSRRGGPWIVLGDRLCKVEHEALVDVAALPPLATAHFVQCLSEDRNGVVWIGTRSHGLYVLDGGQVIRVSTGGNNIMGFAEDADGNLWVTMKWGGLGRLRRARAQFIGRSAGLLVSGVNTVCQDSRGTMWTANGDGGVAQLLPDGTAQPVPTPPGWPLLSAVAVAPVAAGGIWVTAGPGIFEIPGSAAARLAKVAHPSLNIVRCLYAARDGSLWLSVDPARVGRFRDGQLTILGAAEGFTGGDVRCLSEDVQGRIWCGTADGRLYRFDGDRFAEVELGRNPGAVNAIHHDADGTIWLGTTEAGLVIARGGGWRVIGTGAGLPGSGVTQLVADDIGNFWLGSLRGVYRLGRQDILACLEGRSARVHPAFLGKDDGLPDFACTAIYQPSSWRSRDGRLWFATRTGLLCVDPRQVMENQRAPVVRVEAAACDDRPAALAGFAPPVGFRKLQFHFSVLCLDAPELVRAQYRLVGFDSDWIAAGAGFTVAYPRLPPGDYRFCVRAELTGAPGLESSDEFAFTVPERWWETWAARVALALAAGTMIALGARALTTRRLEARLRQAEQASALQQERTRIARNIHDDMGAGLTQVSLLTQDDDPDTAGPRLDRIYGIVNGLTRAMDEVVWAVNPKFDDLDGLVYYVGNWAQDMLSAANVRCRIAAPDQATNWRLTSHVRHQLFLCCKEALHNVVKHAAAQEVTLTVSLEGDRLRLRIADDGIGLDARRGAAGPRVRGNGLANMQARMAEIGGQCELMERSPRGTVVTFTVPLPTATES